MFTPPFFLIISSTLHFFIDPISHLLSSLFWSRSSLTILIVPVFWQWFLPPFVSLKSYYFHFYLIFEIYIYFEHINLCGWFFFFQYFKDVAPLSSGSQKFLVRQTLWFFVLFISSPTALLWQSLAVFKIFF